jgi:hypothetical protein
MDFLNHALDALLRRPVAQTYHGAHPLQTQQGVRLAPVVRAALCSGYSGQLGSFLDWKPFASALKDPPGLRNPPRFF